MDHALEFQSESLAWLRDMRGRRFVRCLRRLVERHGPDEALRRVIHPTMSDEMVECHAAAIQHVAKQLTPSSGLATNGGPRARLLEECC